MRNGAGGETPGSERADARVGLLGRERRRGGAACLGGGARVVDAAGATRGASLSESLGVSVPETGLVASASSGRE